MKPSRGSKRTGVESVRVIRETIVATCRLDEKRDAEDHERVSLVTSAERRTE